jgi:ABC-type multidrug transport system ATPase subunit
MNADRIIVVEDGQVTEEGTHNELIIAQGRYADLWSKQVFVKPKRKGDGEDGNEETPNPTIINDLTPELTTTELAKVALPTTTDANGTERETEAAKNKRDQPVITPMARKDEVESAEESDASSADSNLTL